MSAVVVFADGSRARMPIHFYLGAAMLGQPTAYVRRAGRIFWVKPAWGGLRIPEQASFVEVAL